MKRNNYEEGRSAGPELSLGEKVTGDVVIVLETMDSKKIGDSATVGQLKGAFPYITDRDIDRTTGKSKRSGNNTATVPRSIIVGLAVGALNRSHAGKPPYEKALKVALKNAKSEHETKKANAASEAAKKAEGKESANRIQERKRPGKSRETVVWHGRTKMVID